MNKSVDLACELWTTVNRKSILSSFQDRFNDDYVDDLNDQFEENWYEAEIFRIHSCKTLRLRMEDGQNNLGDWFRQKLLIVENITELELDEFGVGKIPNTSPADTVIKYL